MVVLWLTLVLMMVMDSTSNGRKHTHINIHTLPLALLQPPVFSNVLLHYYTLHCVANANKILQLYLLCVYPLYPLCHTASLFTWDMLSVICNRNLMWDLRSLMICSNVKFYNKKKHGLIACCPTQNSNDGDVWICRRWGCLKLPYMSTAVEAQRRTGTSTVQHRPQTLFLSVVFLNYITESSCFRKITEVLL